MAVINSSSSGERRSFFESNVCRLCSFARDKVLPIFDTSGSKFDAKIKECLRSIEITQGDGKPQQICLECITKLNIYYEFLQHCVRSDAHFDSYIRAIKLKELQCETQEASLADHHSSDGLIVLSKVNESLTESLQDLVVVVELKYKDGVTPEQSLSQDPPPADSYPREWDDLRSLDNLTDSVDSNGKATDAQQVGPITGPEQRGTPPTYFRFNPEKKEFECTLCDKKFKKRTRFNAHLANHTDIRPYSCDHCGKSFAMKWDLNIHVRIHQRDIVCSRCDKAFPTKSKLERHFRVHTGEKPFYCSCCGRTFSDKRNLDNHMRTHSGVKPFACSACSKTFSVRSHMIEHMNVHKKSASFCCAHCDKSFRWRANYKKHLKSHNVLNL